MFSFRLNRIEPRSEPTLAAEAAASSVPEITNPNKPLTTRPPRATGFLLALSRDCFHTKKTRKRFIASLDCFDEEHLRQFAMLAQYRGTPYHLRKPQAKGFPARAHGPNKSLCDGNTSLKRHEANQLLRERISRSMIRTTLQTISSKYVLPKYVWAVKGKHVFEAKLSGGTLEYHEYELLENDSQRDYVMGVWKERCMMN